MKNFGVPTYRRDGSFYIKLFILASLLLWLGVLYARKIDLTTADLGRHLANGKWVVENNFNIFQKDSPVHENFYSYTNPDFPVVNHHWGAGAIFYLLYKLAGFSGLSIFYITFSISAFILFFLVAFRESNFTFAALFSFLLLPLMAERTEVRPEVWSVFFSAIFFFVLWKFSRGELSEKWLFLLPALAVFWVNLHVYFLLGFFLIGAFLVSEIAKVIFSRLSDDEFGNGIKKIKTLFFVLVLAAAGSLVNPFGIKGLTYPLSIFKNYGYTIVENKSVSFVENYGVINPNFFLVKAVLILLILGFLLLLAANRKKISIYYFLFTIFFGVMGWLAIRNLALLGFFSLPVLAYNFHCVFRQREGENNLVKENGVALMYIAVAVISLAANYQYISQHWQRVGLGLAPGNVRTAEFLHKENIRSPFFNNYDIGGYLIFFLPGNEKVFVDNRPEAYPDSFFSQIYKPMQENQAVFEKVTQDYNFRTVIFSRGDITPWGISFLKTIKENRDWAKVFEDNYAIIYKRLVN